MFNDNRKGVVSLTTFSFIVLILILVVGFSYWYYDSSKDDVINIVSEKELVIGMTNLRGAILQLLSVRNESYLNYTAVLDPSALNVVVGDGVLFRGTYDYVDDVAKYNISSLGIEFCSNYSVYTRSSTLFYFNGTCVSIVTS